MWIAGKCVQGHELMGLFSTGFSLEGSVDSLRLDGIIQDDFQPRFFAQLMSLKEKKRERTELLNLGLRQKQRHGGRVWQRELGQ